MRIYLIAVGTKMPTWVSNGYAEFSKRMPATLPLELTEVVAAKRHKTAVMAKNIHQEGQRIQSAIPKNSILIVLDEKGQSLSSLALAEKMQDWMGTGQNVSIVIGGADGIAELIKQQANEIWSLSSFTLPHAVVRIVIAEQIYRAWTILQHSPYHRY